MLRYHGCSYLRIYIWLLCVARCSLLFSMAIEYKSLTYQNVRDDVQNLARSLGKIMRIAQRLYLLHDQTHASIAAHLHLRDQRRPVHLSI